MLRAKEDIKLDGPEGEIIGKVNNEAALDIWDSLDGLQSAAKKAKASSSFLSGKQDVEKLADEIFKEAVDIKMMVKDFRQNYDAERAIEGSNDFWDKVHECNLEEKLKKENNLKEGESEEDLYSKNWNVKFTPQEAYEKSQDKFEEYKAYYTDLYLKKARKAISDTIMNLDYKKKPSFGVKITESMLSVTSQEINNKKEIYEWVKEILTKEGFSVEINQSGSFQFDTAYKDYYLDIFIEWGKTEKGKNKEEVERKEEASYKLDD